MGENEGGVVISKDALTYFFYYRHRSSLNLHQYVNIYMIY